VGYEPSSVAGERLLDASTHTLVGVNEIKRASSWGEPLRVIIEAPESSFSGRYAENMRHRSVGASQVSGTVESWGEHYNVEWVFCENRSAAEQTAFDFLLTWEMNRVI